MTQECLLCSFLKEATHKTFCNPQAEVKLSSAEIKYTFLSNNKATMLLWYKNLDHCLFSEYFLQHGLPSGHRAFRALFKHNSSTSCSPLGIKSFEKSTYVSRSIPESQHCELKFWHETGCLYLFQWSPPRPPLPSLDTVCIFCSLHSTLHLIERYIKNCFTLIQTPSLK